MLFTKKIDTILLMLGKEIHIPVESLIFYHSSPLKFKNINNIGNWFSPIKINYKNDYYITNNIYTLIKPLWSNGYDFKFINKRPLKLLSITTYKNDIDYFKLKFIINIINENIKIQIEEENKNNINNEINEFKKFMLEQEHDPEYILAYYLSKYSSFDGWNTNATYLGFCMLGKETLKKLKLLSISEPPTSDNVTMYYTPKQWEEQWEE
jgi:hypothetical protein